MRHPKKMTTLVFVTFIMVGVMFLMFNLSFYFVQMYIISGLW